MDAPVATKYKILQNLLVQHFDPPNPQGGRGGDVM